MTLNKIVPEPHPVMINSRNFFGNAVGTRLYMNERDSDVSIRVQWDGCSWHIPAHRLILSTMSEVFRSMFRVNMKESYDGILEIGDFSPLTVRQFLKYVYIGILDFDGWTEAVDLLKIAHLYSVNTLVNLCESHLTTVITISNVCHLHELAQTYSLHKLKNIASSRILDAAFIVTSTDGFLNISSESLKFFLSSSKLNMENECCVLTTLKEWAVVDCSRNGSPLTRDNVLALMKPFMHYVNWRLIPKDLRTFVPKDVVEQYSEYSGGLRKSFHVPVRVHFFNVLKFIVELGAFSDNCIEHEGLSVLKFGVDSHAYVTGFKIVGKFRTNSLITVGQSTISILKDSGKHVSKFDLNSVAWINGSTIGDYIWREMSAYLPYPVRIDPFSAYIIKLKYVASRPDKSVTKWPVTHLDCETINTDLGPVNFRCYSACYGLTQLFLLPAPPVRNACNDDDDINSLPVLRERDNPNIFSYLPNER